MQTAGVSGDRKRRDEGRLKSLFWPTVENACDADAINRQGFWVCLVVGVYQFLMAIVAGSAASTMAGAVAIALFGLIAGLFYFLGGMGVRESSWPACAVILGLFSLNLLASIPTESFPAFTVILTGLNLIAEALLIATLRSSVLASRWKTQAEGEDRPTRFNKTFADKLADQWPAAAWPALRVPFFVVGSLLFLVSVAGALAILGILPNPAAS